MKRFNTYDAYQIRYDGRRFDQIRNINFKFGLYPHADGSVYYEQGCTKVICAVYGPRQNRVRTSDDLCFINCQFSLSSFATQNKKKAQRSMEAGRLLERTLKSVIDRSAYPKTRVDVFCEIIQGDGSNLAAYGKRESIMVDYKNCLHINQMERMIEAGFDANEKIYACLREAILLRTEELRKIVAVKEL
uniref:Exoribonuclease phosphorolytic domain-containing protein n=1 Tax=Panagrolaimus sp. PS1159 TaxID=55785 RepID=A0AC35GLN5_9BILA